MIEVYFVLLCSLSFTECEYETYSMNNYCEFGTATLDKKDFTMKLTKVGLRPCEGHEHFAPRVDLKVPQKGLQEASHPFYTFTGSHSL